MYAAFKYAILLSKIWGTENGDNVSDAKSWGCEVKNVQEMLPPPSAL